jgi:hypothetical protein
VKGIRGNWLWEGRSGEEMQTVNGEKNGTGSFDLTPKTLSHQAEWKPQHPASETIKVSLI